MLHEVSRFDAEKSQTTEEEGEGLLKIGYTIYQVLVILLPRILFLPPRAILYRILANMPIRAAWDGKWY